MIEKSKRGDIEIIMHIDFGKKKLQYDGMTISLPRWPYDIAFLSEQMTGLSSLCYQQWMFVLRHSLTPVCEGDSPTS